ncbi:hypothetical protein [Pseudobacteriovorax antillogorgiicola]|nr:hypothetical protein [Pseudobacteriovorax antillogorgiicola]
MAEPWLGTRFAQNCSGCHAPGRKNLPPVLRRCSLSCQGCHVNPNGGGLRSFYGKWNENYWLRSFRVKRLKQPKLIAPFHKQFYGRKQKKLSVQNIRKIIRKGFPLVRSNEEFENELLYDRYHDKFYHVNAKSRREFEFSIPQTDPYRLMDEQKIDGGGDFRFFAYKYMDGEDQDLHPFLMEATFGIRYRPLRHTHFVYEARYLGVPIGQQMDTIPGQEQTRSLYVMQDDLPWNIFVMGGYYRPLFGNYTPDHTALAQEMASFITTGQANSTRNLYKALSVGSAPNVPFGNIHYIMKRVGTNGNDKETGIAGNFGLRFVTFGAQVNYSFWTTTDASEEANSKRVEMHAIEFRGTWREYIVGIEGVSMARDEELSDFREGGVITLEGKYRFWRENYATLDIAQANVARNVLPGSSSQIKLGTKHFLTPGLEVGVSYSMDSDDQTLPTAAKTDQTTLSFMVHTYF